MACSSLPGAAELLESTASLLSRSFLTGVRICPHGPNALVGSLPHFARFSALLILDPWQTGHSGPPPRSPVFPWLSRTSTAPCPLPTDAGAPRGPSRRVLFSLHSRTGELRLQMPSICQRLPTLNPAGASHIPDFSVQSQS